MPAFAQRVVEVGDTVTLRIMDRHHLDPHDIRIMSPDADSPPFWSALLIGKVSGDSVLLPESDGKGSCGVITSIYRP